MKKIVILIGLALSFVGCKDKVENISDGDNYNRKEMLLNWADNIIIPSFQEYATKTNALKESVEVFNATPNQTNLDNLRTQWADTYKTYQYVAMYNFGKAEEISLMAYANTYPVDVTELQNNINNEVSDLSLLSLQNSQGFPALDYMLYGLDSSDSAIINVYTNATTGTKHKNYLLALATRLNSQAAIVLNDWNGTYRATFIADDSNTNGSSVNKLTNLFIKNYEKDIRAGKVGIPSGVLSSGMLHPEKTEAYYAKNLSRALLSTAVTASYDFFNGKHYGKNTSGKSLKDYLDTLDAKEDGVLLSTVINNKYNNIFTAISGVNANLAQQITDNNTITLDLYDIIQTNLITLKLDMLAALQITVDYIDSDGD